MTIKSSFEVSLHFCQIWPTVRRGQPSTAAKLTEGENNINSRHSGRAQAVWLRADGWVYWTLHMCQPFLALLTDWRIGVVHKWRRQLFKWSVGNLEIFCGYYSITYTRQLHVDNHLIVGLDFLPILTHAFTCCKSKMSLFWFSEKFQVYSR